MPSNLQSAEKGFLTVIGGGQRESIEGSRKGSTHSPGLESLQPGFFLQDIVLWTWGSLLNVYSYGTSKILGGIGSS